jgi:hypothetical protein
MIQLTLQVLEVDDEGVSLRARELDEELRTGCGGQSEFATTPRPRDFTSGEFRLVSTWDYAPTDEDLFRTISRGMPGSAMPSWSHLPEPTRWGLVHYVKSFSERPLTIPASREPDADGNDAAGVVSVPKEPPYTKQAELRARATFATSCALCRGPTGKGDGQQKQTDSKGFATRPRDLTLGVYKGNPDPASVYCRIVAGLSGSPMPQNAYLHGEQATGPRALALERRAAGEGGDEEAQLQIMGRASRRVKATSLRAGLLRGETPGSLPPANGEPGRCRPDATGQSGRTGPSRVAEAANARGPGERPRAASSHLLSTASSRHSALRAARERRRLSQGSPLPEHRAHRGWSSPTRDGRDAG